MIKPHLRIYKPAVVLFIFSCIGLLSCNKPARFLGGISPHDLAKLLNMKDYGDRSEATVNDFLKKRHYRYDYSFLSVDSLYDKRKEAKYNDLIAPNNLSLDSLKLSLPQIRIFNADGSHYNSLVQCAGDFLNDGYKLDFPLAKNECSFKNNALELKNEFVFFPIDSNRTSEILTRAQNYKYTVVVYWNIQTNYFSERILRSVSKLKKKHPNEITNECVNATPN